MALEILWLYCLESIWSATNRAQPLLYSMIPLSSGQFQAKGTALQLSEAIVLALIGG